MKLQDLIATALQLLGVYLLCDILGKGMAFISYSNELVDSVRIWMINGMIWLVGLTFSLVFIFAASPIARKLTHISAADAESKINLEKVDSNTIIQVFAGFLLLRQSYYAVAQISMMLRYANYNIIGQLIENGLLMLYFAVTIWASFSVLRRPELLSKLRKKTLKQE